MGRKQVHGLSFEEAKTVFYDDAIIFDDPDHSIGEERFLISCAWDVHYFVWICNSYDPSQHDSRYFGKQKAEITILNERITIMKKTILLIVLLACFTLLFGCAEKNKEKSQNLMYIRPSEFSEETLDVLKLFDDEIQFFDIQLNDTAKSFSISVWQYQDGRWNEIGASSGQAEFLGNRIAVKLDETTYEIYHMDDNGHTSIKSPALDLNFEDTMARIQWKVDQEELLEINKEKIIYAKVGTNKNEVSTSIISTDFREIECDTGIAITLTIYDTELSD